MPTYSITIPQSQPDGTRVQTKLQSDNLPALLRQARDAGEPPGRVRRERPTPMKYRRVREANRIAVFRQLADSFQTGMSLPESLRLIAHETHDPIAKNAVRKLLEQIQSGASFAEAARQSPELFTDTDCALIEAGERGSALNDVFNELTEVSESLRRTARQVGLSFIYPGVISVIAANLLLFFVVFIVPRFVGIFRDFGVSLPGPTQFIVDLARFVQWAFPPVVFSLPMLLVVFMAFRHAWEGTWSFDFWRLRLPLMNHIFYRMAVARGCGMMSILTRHAIPLMEALRLTGETCGNRAIQRGFAGAGIALANGETLARSLEESEAFPEGLVWRVALAESAGDVPATFLQLSRHFAEQAESRMRLLSAIIEPALVLTVGGALGFIVISMFLPLIQIISKLSE